MKHPLGYSKYLFPLVVWCVLMIACLPVQAKPTRLLGKFDCRAWVVLDCDSGRVLDAHKAWAELPCASLTKLMTALVAYDKLEPSRVYVVKQADVVRQPITLGLRPKDEVKEGDLLRAMLLASANDAALAVADAAFGSVPACVEAMNQRAIALGLKHTHFVNPHGLYAPEHYSCAWDLAQLACKVLEVPKLAATCRLREWTFDFHGKPKRLINRNRLLKSYPYALGLKTGYLKQAGKCLAAAAERDDWRLVVILLNCPQRFAAAKAVFEYYFSHYELVKPVQAYRQVAVVQVKGGRRKRVGLAAHKDLVLHVPREVAGKLQLALEAAPLEAPVAEGQPAGKLLVLAPTGEVVGQSFLYTLAAVPAVNRFKQAAVLSGVLILCLGVGLGCYKVAKGIAASRNRLAPEGRGTDKSGPGAR